MLWRLAAPNVVAVSTLSAVTFADAWYVGQLGTAALASLALVFPFLTLTQMMAGGAIGGGVTSAVARALGAGQDAEAARIAWHAVLIAAVMAFVFMLALGVFGRPIFRALGGQGVALEGAVAYARVIFGGAASVWFIFVLAAILRGTGDTTTPARAIATASVLQVLLSGALTLGWFGLPQWGLQGAATATVSCQGGAAAYLAWQLWRGAGRLRLRPQALAWAPFADIMRVGGIGLLNSFCMAMAVVVMTGYVGRYGTAALAGYGVGARLELMLVPIAFGVGAALTAAVGLNVGAGQYARARRFAWTGAGASLILTGVIGATAALRPGLWLDLFTTDPDAYAVGMRYLIVAAPLYGLFGAGQALYFASQGTGRMGWPVTVTVCRFLVIAGLGWLAVSASSDIDYLFATAAVGLAVMGIGQGLCVFGPGWRGGVTHEATRRAAS